MNPWYWHLMVWLRCAAFHGCEISWYPADVGLTLADDGHRRSSIDPRYTCWICCIEFTVSFCVITDIQELAEPYLEIHSIQFKINATRTSRYGRVLDVSYQD